MTNDLFFGLTTEKKGEKLNRKDRKGDAKGAKQYAYSMQSDPPVSGLPSSGLPFSYSP